MGVHLGRDNNRKEAIGTLSEIGSIRQRFEVEPGLSSDDLYTKNISYLTAKNFMRAMDRWNSRTWILQGGGRLPSNLLRNTLFYLCVAVFSLNPLLVGYLFHRIYY